MLMKVYDATRVLTGVVYSLQYHILQGAYQSGSIPDDLAFIPSVLNNTQYANVSGGQVVGVERDDNNVTLFSGLLQNSSVSQAVSTPVFYTHGRGLLTSQNLERELHWRRHSRDRQPSYSATISLRHAFCSRLVFACWRSHSR
jgi:hypothetical protein